MHADLHLCSFPASLKKYQACVLIACGVAMMLSLCGFARADDGLLWFAQGRPTEQARQAVDILAHADAEGLDPAKYHAATLALTLAAAESASNWAEDALVHFDNDLTAAMRRFLSDLHYGQVDPRSISENYSSPTSSFDPAVILETAVRQGRLREAVAQAAPPFPLYADLRAALAQYRGLARETEIGRAHV